MVASNELFISFHMNKFEVHILLWISRSTTLWHIDVGQGKFIE